MNLADLLQENTELIQENLELAKENDQLRQEKKVVHKEISNIFSLFVELGKFGLHQNGILHILFKNETERLQTLRVLIKERIYDGEIAEKQREFLEKLIKQDNQNQ